MDTRLVAELLARPVLGTARVDTEVALVERTTCADRALQRRRVQPEHVEPVPLVVERGIGHRLTTEQAPCSGAVSPNAQSLRTRAEIREARCLQLTCACTVDDY